MPSERGQSNPVQPNARTVQITAQCVGNTGLSKRHCALAHNLKSVQR
jgi:hypothetical protein